MTYQVHLHLLLLALKLSKKVCRAHDQQPSWDACWHNNQGRWWWTSRWKMILLLCLYFSYLLSLHVTFTVYLLKRQPHFRPVLLLFDLCSFRFCRFLVNSFHLPPAIILLPMSPVHTPIHEYKYLLYLHRYTHLTTCCGILLTTNENFISMIRWQ